MRAYSDPEREADPYALPDVRVWQDAGFESRCCNVVAPEEYVTATSEQPCPSCSQPAVWHRLDQSKAWFYEYGMPGCLPDSDWFGPFTRKADAIAAAQQQD